MPAKTTAVSSSVLKDAGRVFTGGSLRGGKVLSSTDTVSEKRLAVTTSGLPSPLKSPTATERGRTPQGKVCWSAKLGVVPPAGVVLSNTDTELSLPPQVTSAQSPFATTRSGL